MRHEYQEIDISKVMSYFIDGYQMKDGESLFNYDYFIDPTKGKVVIKLTIKEDNSD